MNKFAFASKTDTHSISEVYANLKRENDKFAVERNTMLYLAAPENVN